LNGITRFFRKNRQSIFLFSKAAVKTRLEEKCFSSLYIAMTTDEDIKVIDTPAAVSAEEEIDPVLKERQDWIKHMRLKFCIRPEFEITKTMIHEDGTLNQE
jgi:hypothetical protein